MSISGRVGNVETRRSSSGYEFDVTYFVKDADIADYVPDIGELAAWAPETAYVTEYRKEGLGDDWMLYITSAPSSSESISVDISRKPTPEALSAFIQKSYSQSEVLFRKEWFGVRIAGKKDIGEEPFLQNSSGVYYWSNTNIDGNQAVEGDYIFNNATVGIFSKKKPEDTNKTWEEGSTKGSAVYTRAPYNISDSNASLKLIERSVKTRVYTVTYYTMMRPNSIGEFLGFNGSFPSGMAPKTATTYKWKAIDQSFENQKDTNGEIWTRVTRKMEAAPGNLLWKPEMDIYNYAWTW